MTPDLKADPPRVDSPSDINAVATRHLGNGVHVHELEWLADGRVVAYLGATTPIDTSPWPSQPELSFRNYAPIGAAVARPDGDEYVVDLPDRDALNDALVARKEYADEYDAAVIPSLLNLCKDRREMHHDEAAEYGLYDVDTPADLDLSPMEMFHLGRAVGMQKMASLAHRTLSRRLEAPYNGHRKWESREYRTVRERRSAGPLEADV
ncbi:hypothetical protein NDI85_19900 [Halomicroarcula sp. S1AR25-4]|uniref:hypothetical protein n=1 Tax=Haloarcula sp. S1AR25-4 TaxID=2950538 RepID=UPI002874F5A4|nr:hypothetical protein [Halomicroarcula sp. S1AR25-4]MDS0280052.1 hypothetical protein [Halomicroarcula sp. S1AR25-4]